MSEPWFRSAWRRMLVDMHIPDWDEAFLSHYDPERLADLYVRARLASVMFYCQSHVGLCYWPTRTGRMHAGLRGRDVVGDLLAALRARRLGACAYYSLIFNVWAFREHPGWRIVPAQEPPAQAFTRGRMGVCCPNHPEYRAFALAQTAELVEGYGFDGLFFDMTFWPAICLCPHCRERYHAEEGREIPRTIDWCSPEWCAFQAARERWIAGFAADMTDAVKSRKPAMTAYHNFATAVHAWPIAPPLDSARHHDFLGADFYGGPAEQFLVSKLMQNLTEHRPAEFMTSRCVNLYDHVRLRPFEEMETQAFAATLFSSAFLFIDAIDVRGTVNPRIYERIGDIFGRTEPYEPHLGGEPVEEIALYFSSASKMDFAENGLPLHTAPGWGGACPHLAALRGACRYLQEAHLPFGLITRKQFDDLDRYRAIVLPNVLRMDPEEVEAIRQYVHRGGRLYASRYTSLTETAGVRHPDFLLADVFGCHCAGDDVGEVAYLRPDTPGIAAAIAPQDYLSLFPVPGAGRRGGALRLAGAAEGEVLARLTLPYASPLPGTVFDRNWASFHSSPPWQDTPAPVVVRHRYGDGEVIYAAADIESEYCEANRGLFLRLVRLLLPEPLRHEADTHPAVWMNAFDQPGHRRTTVGFLNYQAQLPAVPIRPVPFRVRPPRGRAFRGLRRLPDGAPLPCTIESDGALSATLDELDVFALLAADWA